MIFRKREYESLEDCLAVHEHVFGCDRYFHYPESYGVWVANWQWYDYAACAAFFLVGIGAGIIAVMMLAGWLKTTFSSHSGFVKGVLVAPVWGLFIVFFAGACGYLVAMDKWSIGSVVYYHISDYESWRSWVKA